MICSTCHWTMKIHTKDSFVTRYECANANCPVKFVEPQVKVQIDARCYSNTVEDE